MIVFKTFIKVLKSMLPIVIMYTVILVVFGAVTIKSDEQSGTFSASRPDIYIVNNDEGDAFTDNLVKYLSDKCNEISLPEGEDSLNDALFYRDVNYIVIIPVNYGRDFLDGKDPVIDVKSTGDYQASLAQMMLDRYIKVAWVYRENVSASGSSTKIADMTDSEVSALIDDINRTLEKEVSVDMTTKLDTDSLGRVSNFYNFANYSLLAGCVYIICLILSTFREENIKRRTVVSSMNYRKFNIQLLISNGVFAIVLWALYVALSVIFIGDIMFTAHGIVYIANMFIFTMTALAMAFLIGNIVSNKNALNGIVNVVALGSSFLCGAFVPREWLPDVVSAIGHIFPSYYYIATNDLLKSMEEINVTTLKPVFINMGIMAGFLVLFVVMANVVAAKKRKS